MIGRVSGERESETREEGRGFLFVGLFRIWNLVLRFDESTRSDRIYGVYTFAFHERLIFSWVRLCGSNFNGKLKLSHQHSAAGFERFTW